MKKVLLLLIGVLVISLCATSCMMPMPGYQQQYGQQQYGQTIMQQFTGGQYGMNQSNYYPQYRSRRGMYGGTYWMDGIPYRSRQEYLQYEAYLEERAYYRRGY